MFQTLVSVLSLRHKSCGFCLFMKLLQRLLVLIGCFLDRIRPVSDADLFMRRT